MHLSVIILCCGLRSFLEWRGMTNNKKMPDSTREKKLEIISQHIATNKYLSIFALLAFEDDVQFSLDDLQLVRDHFEITNLDTLRTYIRDPHLKIVSSMKNLQKLSLSGDMRYEPRFTVQGLRYLTQMQNLTSLLCHGLNLTDDMIQQITQIPALQNFTYMGKPLTTHQLNLLQQATKLNFISLIDLESEKLPLDLNHIVALPNLTQVHLCGYELALAENTTLIQELHLECCRFSSNILSLFPKLHHFKIRNCNVKGLFDFQLATNLKSISVSDQTLTQKEIRDILQLTSLEALDLVGQIAAAEIQNINKLVHLKSVNLSHSVSINDVIDFLPKNIEHLDASFAKIHHSTVEKLCTFPKLRCLAFRCSSICRDDLLRLVALDNLHEIDLTHTQVNQTEMSTALLHELQILSKNCKLTCENFVDFEEW